MAAPPEQSGEKTLEAFLKLQSEEKEKNRARSTLAHELLHAGIHLSKWLPKWVRTEKQRVFLDELRIALEAPIHEGMIPPYGSIVLPPGKRVDPFLPLQARHLSLGREAADGSSALLVYEHDGSLQGLKLLDPAGAPELQISTLASELDAIAYRRERNGAVRVYIGNRGALRHISRRWSVSPSPDRALDDVLRAAPMVNPVLLCKLLEFALYVMSPRSAGATLVWLLDEKNPFSASIDLRPLNLRLIPDDGLPSLAFTAHLLAQHDGATILSSNGHFLSTGIHLEASDRAKTFIKAFSGTRHTSAIRASFDCGNCLVVTVSSDGPVSVFSDGMSVFTLQWFDAEKFKNSLKQVMGDDSDDRVSTDSWTAICGTCGKTSTVESVWVAGGWSEQETVACPICGHTIAEDKAFRLVATIVKVL